MNKIREVPHHESVLVTHTDSAEVYVWSLERQPNRASDKVVPLTRTPPGAATLYTVTAFHSCWSSGDWHGTTPNSLFASRGAAVPLLLLIKEP